MSAILEITNFKVKIHPPHPVSRLQADTTLDLTAVLWTWPETLEAAAAVAALAGGNTRRFRSKTVDVAAMACEASTLVLTRDTRSVLWPVVAPREPCSPLPTQQLAASSTYYDGSGTISSPASLLNADWQLNQRVRNCSSTASCRRLIPVGRLGNARRLFSSSSFACQVTYWGLSFRLCRSRRIRLCRGRSLAGPVVEGRARGGGAGSGATSGRVMEGIEVVEDCAVLESHRLNPPRWLLSPLQQRVKGYRQSFMISWWHLLVVPTVYLDKYQRSVSYSILYCVSV